MAVPVASDWQSNKHRVCDRGAHLLQTGIWSDCRFIVGTEANQQFIEGHKLFLAMASPVFEAMFYGGMAEKNPIAILDVQPEAFKDLLEYIYTDQINLNSFDRACELCYAAKKYMLPNLVKSCTEYLWSDLNPKNACRAYEFAKLFEEEYLKERSLEIICKQTKDVLQETSFDDVDLSTLLTILDQDYLNITSELDLFNALEKYANRQTTTESGAKVRRLSGIASPNVEHIVNNNIRDALAKIRFLTMSPQQFAEGPGISSLLTQSEKFAILMKISSRSSDVQLPAGFSSSTLTRNKSRYDTFDADNQGQPLLPTSCNLDCYDQVAMLPYQDAGDCTNKSYCRRQLVQLTECMNSSVLDCSLTFSCDKNISVYGITVPTQILIDESGAGRRIDVDVGMYNELLYAHLLDADGSRMTYTHYTGKVKYHSTVDISFNRPVYIQKNKLYKVGVVLNKSGRYPMGTFLQFATSKGVEFRFGQGQCGDTVRDGLIRSIIFCTPLVSRNSAEREMLLPNVMHHPR